MKDYNERLKEVIRANQPGTIKGDALRKAIALARREMSDDRIAEEIERYGIDDFIRSKKK